jgi:hypothetical protein
MDMTRYLKPYLTVPVLEALGGEYEGIIAEVVNERLRNRFKATSSDEPVIVFQDGKRLVLNKAMLQASLCWFGEDSARWPGRRIRVFLRRVETVNRESGKVRVSYQRAITCEDVHAIVSAPEVVPKAQVDNGARASAAMSADEIRWEHELEAGEAIERR